MLCFFKISAVIIKLGFTKNGYATESFTSEKPDKINRIDKNPFKRGSIRRSIVSE